VNLNCLNSGAGHWQAAHTSAAEVRFLVGVYFQGLEHARPCRAGGSLARQVRGTQAKPSMNRFSAGPRHLLPRWSSEKLSQAHQSHFATSDVVLVITGGSQLRTCGGH
jgi:hypothetical protein